MRKKGKEEVPLDGGRGDLQTSVIIFIKISLCLHSRQPFRSALRYIHPPLCSAQSVSSLPSRGSPRWTRSHGAKKTEGVWKEEGKKKKSNRNEKTSFFFFLSSSPVCWHELKARRPALAKKTKTTKKRKVHWKLEKKKRKLKTRQVPRASGPSKCLANRWSCCSSLWDFQKSITKNQRERKKTKKEGKLVDKTEHGRRDIGELSGGWHLEVWGLQVR